MLKKAAVIVLLVCCAFPVFSQNAKPRLGILPFTGGSGEDGETIATLFSTQSDILSAFTVVPRTGAVNALVAEQTFQLSGYTDSDTIAHLGRLLNADFVISGHILHLGSRNLLITTIVNVESFELLAGDYREYETIKNVPVMMPDISRIIIRASRRDTSKLPKLAIVPFTIANQGGSAQDAEVLAQILAVESVNAGKYAVLPRTTAMQTAMKEQEFQLSWAATDEKAKALGRAINAEFVLNVEVRSFGPVNMFGTQIFNVEDDSVQAGGCQNYYRIYYRTIADGLSLMVELARLLTDTNAAARLRDQEKRQAVSALLFSRQNFWSAGLSLGTALADPWLIGAVHWTAAPLRYSFLEIGCDIGFISHVENVEYYSVYPFAHYALFLPFKKSGGLYAGIGGGYMIAEYHIDDFSASKTLWAGDIIIGCNIGNYLDISYTLRTDFASTGNKLALGYVYRFK